MKGQPTKDEQLRMYGERLDTLADVQKVFVNFISQNVNENGVKVSWNSQVVIALFHILFDVDCDKELLL